MSGFTEQVGKLVEELQQYRGELCCNPWYGGDEVASLDVEGAAERRTDWLTRYLVRRRGAKVLFVAEAAGYQGCRFTGIPITCERMLMNAHARVNCHDVLGVEAEVMPRTSQVTAEMNRSRQAYGYNEPTDTVVWGAALDHGLAATDFVLWNIFPFHPYREGNFLSNRTPTEVELRAGADYLRRLLAIYPVEKIFAVGRKSAVTMQEMGMEAIALRHPANGGVGEFRRGLAAAL